MLPFCQLFALERDKRRFKILTTMLSRAGCKNVEPLNIDFLTLDPSDPKYGKVTHMSVPILPLQFNSRSIHHQSVGSFVQRIGDRKPIGLSS